VLHDVVEDSDWTLKQLREEGFSDEVVKALSCLTHAEGVSYETYIGVYVGPNLIAREVKLRDLEHNSKITRIKGLRPKDLERVAKY
ncbi:hypothetical protein ABK046_48435, partial [Streptomyces caeruleatus]